MQPDRSQLPRDVHAAVAGLEREPPFCAGDANRSIARPERQLAGNILRVDAAIVRVQMSACAGTEMMSFALAERPNPKPVIDWLAGFFTSNSIVFPSCVDLISSAFSDSRVGPRFSIS